MGDIIYICHGTFHKFLKENDMPVAYFRKALKARKAVDISLKHVKKENREKTQKYLGWYAKED